MSLTTSPGMWPVHLERASRFTGLMTWSVDRSILVTQNSLLRAGRGPCSATLGQWECWEDLGPDWFCP
jgi:hypothetical protein